MYLHIKAVRFLKRSDKGSAFLKTFAFRGKDARDIYKV